MHDNLTRQKNRHDKNLRLRKPAPPVTRLKVCRRPPADYWKREALWAMSVFNAKIARALPFHTRLLATGLQSWQLCREILCRGPSTRGGPFRLEASSRTLSKTMLYSRMRATTRPIPYSVKSEEGKFDALEILWLAADPCTHIDHP